MEGSVVKKSNVLARCRMSIDSKYQHQLIALTACRIRCDDKDFHEYEIPLTDFKIDESKAAGSTQVIIKNAAKALMQKTLEIKDGKSWSMYNVFSKVRYDDDKKSIIVRFDPDLKPHYLDLNKYFTQYPLIEYMSLPSVYSQKIYELLRSYDDQQEITLGVKELHEMLQTNKSAQKSYAEFNRYILKPAHKNITGLTSLLYEYEPIKRGRKYAEIRFTFGYKKREETKKKNNKNQAKKNNAFGKRVIKCWEANNKSCDKDLDTAMCKWCRDNLQNQ
ncbi:MAG: replication initiation protein [Halomonas sp.]|nr:replication initiation protein [Halomonas sp.]